MSLVAASEEDTSDQNGKPSTPPRLTLSTLTIVTTRQSLHLAINTWDVLPASRPTISSRFQQNALFPVHFYFFQFEYVRTHFVFIFLYLPFLHPSLLGRGSAEQFTDPFLVFSRLAGAQFATTLPASPPTILFWFEQTLRFRQFTLHHFGFQQAYTFSCSMIYLPFLCPSVLLQAQQSDLLTKF